MIGQEKRGQTVFFFSSVVGVKLTICSVNPLWNKICARMGTTPVMFYTFSHDCANSNVRRSPDETGTTEPISAELRYL